MYPYEVTIRLNGWLSQVNVTASSAGHAKQLVEAQYGGNLTVLRTKRLQ